MRYLFTVQTSNDLGLLTRSLPIAAELAQRGHRVAFCNPAPAPSRVIREAGFENLLLKHPLHYITALQARGEFTLPGLFRQVRSGAMRREFENLSDLLVGLLRAAPARVQTPVSDVWSVDHLSAILFLSDERFARAELEAWIRLVEMYQPDAIIDSWNPLACLAAHVLNKPLVTILQADMHPDNRGFIRWKVPPADVPSPAPTLNRIARAYGAPPIRKTENLFLGDLPLILGIPETEPIPAGSKGTYIGTVLWQNPGEQLPPQIDALDPGHPLIWLYLGNPRYFAIRTPYDSELTIRACMRILANEPVHMVLTTGHHPLPEKLLPLPENFHWFPFVPGLQMARRSQLLIHHGGYDSCQKRLATGTPADILPTYSERESNARRVVQAGAGQMVLPVDREGKREISPEIFRSVVRETLSKSSYRANAQRIAQTMLGYGGKSLAANLIVKESAPPLADTSGDNNF